MPVAPTLFAWTNHTAVALAGRHKIFGASNRMCLRCSKEV